MRTLVFVLLSIVATGPQAQFGEERIDVLPAEPVAFAPVHARITNDHCQGPRDIRFTGSRIVITYDYLPMCDTVEPPQAKFVLLGRLPPGEWTVAVERVNGQPYPDLTPVTFTIPASARFVVPPREGQNRVVADISGLWGIDGRDGSGVTFTTAADGRLAGLLYIYDDGSPWWYSLQFSDDERRGGWTGTAFRTSAPGTLYGPMPSPAPTYTTVDNATLQFLDPTRLTLCLDNRVALPPAEDVCYTLFRYPFD